MRCCGQLHGTVLLAHRSAIEPWARRACELCGVPTLTFSDRKWMDQSAGVRVSAKNLDELVIMIADEVTALSVRRGGRIESSLIRRVKEREDASTRLAIGDETTPKVASALLDQGVLGVYWCSPRDDVEASGTNASPEVSVDDAKTIDAHWLLEPSQWLVHCTRGRSGPWPGETRRQYQDAILLGDDPLPRHTPIAALQRIIRCGRLMGSAVATAHKTPVVCFSAVDVRELVARRCFRSHLGRWDYESYGISIRRCAAERIGAKPVIYLDDQDQGRRDPADEFRTHPVGKNFDWQREQEWRIQGNVDLTQLSADDVRVFVPSNDELNNLTDYHGWTYTVLPLPS